MAWLSTHARTAGRAIEATGSPLLTLDATCGTAGGEPLGDQPDAVQDEHPNEVVGPDQAIGLREITLILQRKESPVPYLLMENGAGRWTDRNQENTPPQRQGRNPNLPVRQAEGKCARLFTV